MRLFWQVYASTLACVLLSVASMTAVLTYRDAGYSLTRLRSEQRLLAQTAGSQVESGYHDQTWPFEMLWAIAKEQEFAFWAISDGTGRVVLSDGAIDPRLASPRRLKQPDWTMTPDGATEQWAIPLAVGSVDQPWVFRLGYHSDGVRAHTREILVTNTLAALGTAVLAVLLSFLLTRQLVRPLQSLTTAASELERGNLDVSLPDAGGIELRKLIQAFRAMARSIRERDRAIQENLESLQRSRDELEARVAERTRELEASGKSLALASRKAGMAEIATSVLHNVGNVLNSVNVSAGILADGLRDSSVGRLSKAADLLKSRRGDLASFFAQPAGKVLPEYLAELARELEAERQRGLAELESLLKSVQHIKSVVRTQQNYARDNAEVVEDVELPGLVEEAMQIAGRDIDKEGITLERDFAATPKARVDRHKVIQILVNLISNARQALAVSAKGERRLVFQTRSEGERMVSIRVVDNGIGIEPENLVKIFSHGFTTKTDGHGFGLHGSAVSAMELGGTLVAESDGPEKGAAFALTLPAAAGKEGPRAG